ncbi:hypothetical protein NSB04_06970 [Blautia pseudococcoides]|nr:hypothetical protein [uncultured Blautia sp.]MCR2019484.1 hypothetical protein [Blautia pseudococcoides]
MLHILSVRKAEEGSGVNPPKVRPKIEQSEAGTEPGPYDAVR